LSSSWESESMGRGRRKGQGRIMGKRWVRVKVGGQHGGRMGGKGLLGGVCVGGWVSRICGGKERGRAIVDGIEAFWGELVDGRRSRGGGLGGWERRVNREEYKRQKSAR